jgi:lipoyl(octanoyl) transferase
MTESSLIPRHTGRVLEVRELGTVAYAEALRMQEELVVARRAGEVGDTLLLLEHPHVITMGTGTHEENILISADERERRGVELYRAGRGGDVTYHGPGQLVGYPILDLKPDRCDLHRYLRDLEEVLILTLEDFGMVADRREGMTGVWVGDRKLAAIGVRVSSGWITSHGFALNVGTDLSFFGSIVPCGIREYGVGSISGELGREVSIAEASERVVTHFTRVFERATAG